MCVCVCVCLCVCVFTFNRLYLFRLPSESLQNWHIGSLGGPQLCKWFGGKVARLCTCIRSNTHVQRAHRTLATAFFQILDICFLHNLHRPFSHPRLLISLWQLFKRLRSEVWTVIGVYISARCYAKSCFPNYKNAFTKTLQQKCQVSLLSFSLSQSS